ETEHTNLTDNSDTIEYTKSDDQSVSLNELPLNEPVLNETALNETLLNEESLDNILINESENHSIPIDYTDNELWTANINQYVASQIVSGSDDSIPNKRHSSSIQEKKLTQFFGTISW